MRWTLGQTGHGWRSGLDGDWEWSLPLPTCLRVHVQGRGQGAAASPLSIEIRRFAYRSIIRTHYELMTLPTEYWPGTWIRERFGEFASGTCREEMQK